MGGTRLEQRERTRPDNRLRATAGSQLAKQVADVFFDGGQGDDQGLSDLLIRGPSGEQGRSCTYYCKAYLQPQHFTLLICTVFGIGRFDRKRPVDVYREQRPDFSIEV